MVWKGFKSLDVALSVARHLSQAKSTSSKNLVFSPLSLNVAVSQIGAGASGSCLKQVLSFLKSDSLDKVNKRSSALISFIAADASPAGGPKISFSNGIWIQQGLSLKHSYKHLIYTVYKASPFRVDFVTQANRIARLVNLWLAKKTNNGLMSNVVSPDSIPSTARFVMANAVYFKGEWIHAFPKSKTKVQEFHLLDGNPPVQAKFMTSTDKHLIRKYKGFKAIRLPYKMGKDESRDSPRRGFSMYIFLPDSKDGLFPLYEKLASDLGIFDNILDDIPWHSLGSFDRVPAGLIQVPKFKISFGFEASETVKQLGVTLPFEAGGLSEIVESPEEANGVSGLYQEAVIEVSEQEEEEVYSVFGVIRPSRLPPVEKFVADHPFIFLIQDDKRGEMPFFGHVLNPLQE